MKRALAGLGCVVALYAFASPAVAQTSAAVSSDASLNKRIEQRIHSDASLKKFDVKVSVDGDIATLTGVVATDAQKARAATLANVKGISRVDNQITVDAYAGTKGTTGKIEDKTKEGYEKTKDATKEGYEKTKEGAGKATDKTKEGLNKAGEEITDTWITGHIKERFMGVDVLKGSDIDVSTDAHVVTLTGTVPTAAARTHAVSLAKTTSGVKRVVDKLTIAPPK